MCGILFLFTKDLLDSLPDRSDKLKSLNEHSNELISANPDLSAAAALKSELHQVNKQFQELKQRLDVGLGKVLQS